MALVVFVVCFVLFARSSALHADYERGEDDGDGSEGGFDRDRQQGSQLERERALMAELSGYLQVHRPPPVLLGSGRTKLSDKFCATMHALALESPGPEGLSQLCKEMVSTTTDMGTEFSLSRVAPVPANIALPWMMPPEPAVKQSDAEDDLDDDWGELPEYQWPLVGFDTSMPIPGLLHVISNIATNVVSASKLLDETVTKLAAVSKLVRREATRDRLLERCFSDPVGKCFQAQLKRFSGKVHRKRWGTVAFCVEEVLDIQRPLRFGWNKERYIGTEVQQAADDDRPEHEKSVSVEECDSAISDPSWWANLILLNRLNSVIREAMIWAESCPCHMDLDHKDSSKKERDLCAKCPLRGRRCHELAAGDFFTMLSGWVNEHSAAFMLELPTDITAVSRACLLAELESGRASIIFNFTLKLSCLMEPPWLAFAIGHPDRSKAVDACKRCLDYPQTHPLLVELQTNLRAEAESFVHDDMSLFELPNLLTFAGKLRFSYSVERLIEGEHSHLHRYVKKAPHHGMAYDSLGRRLQEIKAKLHSSKAAFQELSEMLSKARNPKQCVQVLGLGNHPSCSLARDNWDPIWQKIVYHADPYSLQIRARREVTTQPPGPPGKPPGIVEAKADPEPLPDEGPPLPPPLMPPPNPPVEGQPSASCKYDEFLHKHACAFLMGQIKEVCAEHSRRFFCMPVSVAAMNRLRDLLVPSLKTPRHVFDAIESICARQTAAPEFAEIMFFTVVSNQPSNAHLPTEQAKHALTNTDIGISVHQVVGVAAPAHTHFKVTALPVQTHGVEHGVVELAMVLSLSHVPIASLLEFRCWEVTDDLCFDLQEADVVEPYPSIEHAHCISKLFLGFDSQRRASLLHR